MKENLALQGSFVSPKDRRPLTWDSAREVFVTTDGNEVFTCIDGNIPDFRPGELAVGVCDIGEVRSWLEELWSQSELTQAPSQELKMGSAAEGRQYWWFMTKTEIVEFFKWGIQGFGRYTQRDSMAIYRNLADVYPNAMRQEVHVLSDGHVARTTRMLFKRLSLNPIIDLIREEGIRSVLDFGCGWGANTILLRQLFPELEIWSFDYSPQRVLATQFNLRRLGLMPYRLFVADGSRIPLPDSSMDLVFTTHVLEQMREVLSPALYEIYRVARRFACHIEPTYRYARWPHRLRMHRLGYPRDIAEQALKLKWTLVDYRPAPLAWGHTPTELIMLRKK